MQLSFRARSSGYRTYRPRNRAQLWAQGREAESTDTTSVMEELEANLTTLSNHSGKSYGSELYADYRGAQAINDLVNTDQLFFHHMAQTWCQRHQPWLDDPHP